MVGQRDDLRTFRLKRSITLCCYVLQAVAHGISFFIFPPILAAYLADIHSKNIALYEGLIFALEPIVGSVAAVVLGRLCDKTRQAKLILILLQLSQVIGNLFYSVRITEWTIVIGKAFCGLGEEAFFSVATGELATCYYGKAESWALLLLTMGFAFGMAVGPLLNFLLYTVDFQIGKFSFNAYNTPGLLIAALHFVMAVYCALAIFDMSTLSAQYRMLRANPDSSAMSFTSSDAESDIDVEFEGNDNIFQSSSANVWQLSWNILRRRPIGSLMLMSFFFMTLTMSSMTLIPLSGLHLLQLTTNDIVVAFSLAGTMSVIGNIFVYTLPFSFRMGHVLILTMVFFLFQTACILIVTLDIALLTTSRTVFYIWSGLHGITFIFADLICRTMVAILTPRGHRSLAEGLRQVSVCTGYFFGGLIGGYLFSHPLILGFLTLAIVCIAFIIFFRESHIIMKL